MSYSTDGENETIPFTKSDPEWKIFEKHIADEQRRLEPGAIVKHNASLDGLVSRAKRQIDVLVTGRYLGRPIRIAIECKRYVRKLGIGKIDEFAGKLLDLKVEYGILYAFNGVTDPARDRAQNAVHPTILLSEIDTALPKIDLPGWDGLFKGFGDCQNPNCIAGDILWREWQQSDGAVITAGSCASCGTWAYRCLECDEAELLMTFPTPCYACGLWEYRLTEDHNGGEEVEATKVSP